MFCKHCGKKITNAAKFCIECGKTVESSEHNEPASTTKKDRSNLSKLSDSELERRLSEINEELGETDNEGEGNKMKKTNKHLSTMPIPIKRDIRDYELLSSADIKNISSPSITFFGPFILLARGHWAIIGINLFLVFFYAVLADYAT